MSEALKEWDDLDAVFFSSGEDCADLVFGERVGHSSFLEAAFEGESAAVVEEESVEAPMCEVVDHGEDCFESRHLGAEAQVDAFDGDSVIGEHGEAPSHKIRIICKVRKIRGGCSQSTNFTNFTNYTNFTSSGWYLFCD